jgi:hypothetical protein
MCGGWGACVMQKHSQCKMQCSVTDPETVCFSWSIRMCLRMVRLPTYRKIFDATLQQWVLILFA